MDTYTVTFFGHRELSDALAIEERLKPILVGRDGEFDQLVSSAVREAAEKYGSGNTSLVLVLPYERAEYRDNIDSFLVYYDEVEICPESANAHFKAAIGIRNRVMVDRADLVICVVERESGGAYTAIKYAEKQGKRVVNLMEYRQC